MKMKPASSKRNAQTAVEYMILLGAVAVVVLVGFTTFLPRAQKESEGYFNTTVNQIYGTPPEADYTRTNYP